MIRAVNYSETIAKGKLIYRSQYYNLAEVVVFICINSLIFGFMEYLFINSFSWENTATTRFGVLAIILLNIGILFLFYKKAKQRTVLKIQTGISKAENRQVVEKFMKESNSWDNTVCNEDYFIGEHYRGFSDKPPHFTVVFCERYIMINALGYNYRGFRGPWLRGLTSLKNEFIASFNSYKADLKKI